MSSHPHRSTLEVVSQRYWREILLISSLLIVAASLLFENQIFMIDELIYLWSAAAMASDGSLIVRSDYEQFNLHIHSLSIFIDGPNGPTSQYPVGITLLYAAAFHTAGLRGIIILNAFASALTLFITRHLAWEWFKSHKVALAAPILLASGTFWLEYAFGALSHAISTAVITLSVLTAYKAYTTESQGRSIAAIWSWLTGTVIGFGILIRLDSVLLLPALVSFAILWLRAPTTLVASGALGVFPGLVASYWANGYKFGDYNPFSYGLHGGGADIRTYVGFGVAIGLALISLISIRMLSGAWTRRFLLALGAICVGAIASLPTLREFLLEYLNGFMRLVVDIRKLPNDSIGLHRNPDGTVQIWGFTKKALGQSIPWLGILILLLSPWPKERRPPFTLGVCVLIFFTTPYLILSWHGGFSSNMRYLTPILPILCILGARLWFDFDQLHLLTGGELFVGLFLGAVIWIGWVLIGPSRIIGAEEVLAYWWFLASVLASASIAIPGLWHTHRVKIARIVLLGGFLLGFFHGVMDLAVSQRYRQNVTLSQINCPSVFTSGFNDSECPKE